MLKTVVMRSAFAFILISLFLVSCSDGDLIVSTFDFEDSTLSLCGENETQVFFNINNDNINETISFKTNRTAFGNSTEFKDYLVENSTVNAITNDTNAVIKIALNSNNEIIYRTYDGEVTSSYFCNEIPPSSPKVINEFKSVSGDVDSFLEITTSVLIGDDDDGDNISNVDEGKGTGKDTDGDSIPDYLDVDDDGDNVLTSTERIANPGDPTTDDGYLDTDIDGIANYLDDDDDDDTIPTRLEITSAAQSPTLNKNEANIAKYLDKFSKDEFDGEPNVITNNISLKYVSRLTAKNVKFKKQGDNGEEISYTSFVLGTFTSDAIRTEIIPTITEEEISSRTR